MFRGQKLSFFMFKKPTEISITTEYITLGQFLKLADIIQTGGEAKEFLASNKIKIDGAEDNRRGKKLRGGETIEISGQVYLVKK